MVGSTESRLKQQAAELGFSLVGITRPEKSAHGAFYRRWLDSEAHGDMSYLSRADAVARREDPVLTLDVVRSIVVVGHEYFSEDAPNVPEDPSVGVIARYARGRDYHTVVKKKLLELLRWLEHELDVPLLGRAYVDTGPILERELGARAGLGWFGKNTMLVNPRRGSWFFLGSLLLDLPLEADAPFAEDRCGTCTRCLDACPTGALLGRDESGAPVIDARRCISYLTIENRGAIPTELRPLIGNRVYGCDICQEVCPFNVRFARETDEPGYAARGPGELPAGVQALPSEVATARHGVSAETRPRVPDVEHPGTRAPSLTHLLETTLDERRWEAFSRGSAIRRAGRAGFARNVCVAIGNWLADAAEPPEDAVAALTRALEDPEPLVREHAAWALARRIELANRGL